MPNLLRLSQEGHRFTRFFSQACVGATSDAEFCVMNSLLPTGQGATAWRFQDNSFNALPSTPCQAWLPYPCRADLATNMIWNVGWMHHKYASKGFTPAMLLSTGMKRLGWFPITCFSRRVLPLLQDSPRALFCSSNDDDQPRAVQAGSSEQTGFGLRALQGSLMSDYLQSAHYVDSALGKFLSDLKAIGLYDESVIVIYGDHEGIPPSLLDTVGDYEGHGIDQQMRGRVPLLVIIPRTKPDTTTADPAGQIDLAPTLLHLLGVSDKNRLFSRPQFVSERSESRGLFANREFLEPFAGIHNS